MRLSSIQPHQFRLVLALLVSGIVGILPAAAQQLSTPEGSRSFPASDLANRGSFRSVLRPWADLQLSAKAAGVIEQFHVNEGAMIKAGDPILSLDSDEEKAEVLHTEAAVRGSRAELDRAVSELERIKPLTNERIYSEKQSIEAQTVAEIARSRYEQGLAVLATARARLANRTVTSPIDGIFLKTNKSVGEAVERFETVARVIDISRIEMTVYCDGRFYDSLKSSVDVKVRIIKDLNNQPVVDAKVIHVDPIIDPNSLTFRIKLQLAPSSGAAPGYAAILIPPPN